MFFQHALCPLSLFILLSSSLLPRLCPLPLIPLLSQITYSVEKVNLYITAEESATGFEIPITRVLKIVKLVGLACCLCVQWAWNDE